MTFKIGDRVHYVGPCAQADKSDFGTVVSRARERAGVWWVDWDNGERLHVQDLHIGLARIVKLGQQSSWVILSLIPNLQ